MAFSPTLGKTVVFVGGNIEPGAKPPLRGTGFITQVPSADDDSVFLYVVTAAHVVRPLISRFIRLRRRDGSIFNLDIPEREWAFHDTADIAAGGFSVDPQEFDLAAIPTTHYVGRIETRIAPGPGDDVVFAGLLALVKTMGQRRIPMLRAGTIGAINQDGIPMRSGDGLVNDVRGHLIDCRSFGGFSGSPCFVSFTSAVMTTPRLGLTDAKRSTALLGIVGGHFDMDATVTLPDQQQELSVPVSAGIAVVLPADLILDLLEGEELKEQRDKEDVRRLGAPPTGE